MVQCKDCGFLAVGYGEGELPGPTPDYRETGRRNGPDTNPAPHCLVLAERIRDEFAKLQQDAARKNYEPHKVALDVITTERDCGSFYRWHPGFSPKEHLEMKHHEELRAEMEERKRQDETRAQTRLEEDRKWRADQEVKNANTRYWQQIKLQALTAAFTVVVTVVLACVFSLKRDGTPIVPFWNF